MPENQGKLEPSKKQKVAQSGIARDLQTEQTNILKPSSEKPDLLKDIRKKLLWMLTAAKDTDTEMQIVLDNALIVWNVKSRKDLRCENS